VTAISVRPRRPGGIRATDALRTLGAFGSALVITYLGFLVTPLDGPFGFFVIALLLFLLLDYLLVRQIMDRKHATDHVVTTLVWLAALITALPLVLIIETTVRKGLPGLSLNFFTKTLEGVDPSAPSTSGGALHAITGTLTQVAFAVLVAVPFGILTAVYLTEIKGRFSGVVRLLVDAMSGIPSIVAGLFIYAVWVIGPGGGFSGFAASLSLGILMLPTVARTSEEMFKLVDPSLREASLALGSPQWRTVLTVVLPTARAGIVTAVILGIARVAGETAPLLMTAFGNDRVVSPKGALSEPQSALPLFVFQQLQQDQKERAWTGALVLIGLVLILFVIARFVSRGSKTAR
jgi:phosphate transport system permease protein